MKHFLLMYEVAADYLQRRGEFRALHLAKAWAASDRGELLLGGALTEPADTAILLFQGEDRRVAEQFAETDPYVLNGLVKTWTVREWVTVAGPGAATPRR